MAPEPGILPADRILVIKTAPLRFLEVALAQLSRDGHRPHITVIAPRGERNTLLSDERVSEVIPISGGNGIRENWALLRQVRGERFDLALVLYGYLGNFAPPLVELAALLSGARRVAAFDVRNHRFRVLRPASSLLSLRKRLPRGMVHYWLSTVSRLARSSYVLGKPVYLTLEPTTACNAACPVCETGDHSLRRGRGMMKWEDYTRIVDDLAPHTNTMLLYFMGESFLHNRIYDMIKYAKQKRIVVTTCTNGDFVDPIKVVESGIDQIEFQMGGVTQSTHEIYRANSMLDRGVRNARAIVKERNRRGLAAPVVTFNLIVMKQNEHEIERFRALAAEIGADECGLITPTVRTAEQARQFLPADRSFWQFDALALEKDELRLRRELYPNNRCDWLYYSTVITYNGDVVPCCRDPHGLHVIGNVLEEGFAKVWNSERYRAFRRQVLTRQKDSPICALCSSYPAPILR